MSTQKIILYVDDLRDCPIGFVVTSTFQKVIQLLENHEVAILSLDHDLGEDLQGNLLPTGYDLVKGFIDSNIEIYHYSITENKYID